MRTPDGGTDAGPMDGGSVDADPGGDDAGFERDAQLPDGGGSAGLICQACTDDTECDPASYCVELPSGGSVCLRSCVIDLPDCPPRFDCVNSLITPTPMPVCTPIGERCCVDADSDDHGSGVGCRGADCDDTVASVHSDAPESCNGVDDDCNGTIDDGDPGAGLVCSTGMTGACASGATACTDGAIQCVPNAASTVETCDGRDEDCDSNVDEDDAGRALTRSCYDGPAGTEGVGGCVAGVQTCAGGEFRACVGAVLPSAERCDGVDEDCDGTIDDGSPGGGIACTASVPGVCAAGTTACTGGAIGCASTIAPGSLPEICDNLDNDCDGLTNEGFTGLGTACTSGAGECRRAGVRICDAADPTAPAVCDAVPGTPSASELCDYRDDDCDTRTDEGYAGLGTACTAGAGTCRRLGVRICDAAAPSGPPICDAVPGAPSPVETCDYEDDDCDGTTDEGYAGLGTVCFAGVGVCRRGGIRACDASAPTGPAVCDATAGSPTAETCDFEDDDCDGRTDETFLTGRVCTAGVGACLRSGVTECTATGTGIQCNAVAGPIAPETCDNVDNDCDGTVDDGFAFMSDPATPGVSYPLGSACAVGLGACRRGGVVACSGGAAGCTAPVVAGGAESCNYIDDDCDGTVDDGFVNGSGIYNGNRDCGACGIDCTAIFAFPGSFGTCSVAGSTARCQLNCNAGSFNLNGIPDDGCEFTLDPGAIYVSGEDPSPLAADDATCGLGPIGTGAANHPCRTVGFGITRATATSRARVRVADALYSQSITLVNGISLLGGYRADTWERHLSTTLTTIRAPGGAGHLRTITASGITATTLVEGFVIEGADATSPGANSYAIYVTGGTNALTFSSNVIYTGNGAPGGVGTAGTDGLDGVNGTGGMAAFDTGSGACASSRAASAGGARTCGGIPVSGGAGGGVACPIFWDNAAPYTTGSASTGAPGAGSGAGAGGPAAFDGQTRAAETCLLCYLPPGGGTMTGGNGLSGTTGGDGAGGTGAASPIGSVVTSEWVGASGTPGGVAANGGGGGGGGAGGGGDGTGAGCTDDLGATGGGGGSGACGGTNGGAGSAGGGAFGIFIVNTTNRPVLTGNTIYRGFGGTGGNGGRGGAGGVGGAGADGGLKSTANASFCTGDGGVGGDGGGGGHGGGGGGGAGGASYGIYASGTTGYGAGTNTFPSSGGGGAGGGGGPSIGTSGTAGVAGASSNTN